MKTHKCSNCNSEFKYSSYLKRHNLHSKSCKALQKLTHSQQIPTNIQPNQNIQEQNIIPNPEHIIPKINNTDNTNNFTRSNVESLIDEISSILTLSKLKLLLTLKLKNVNANNFNIDEILNNININELNILNNTKKTNNINDTIIANTNHTLISNTDDNIINDTNHTLIANTDDNIINDTNKSDYICELCNNSFTHRQSLYKHKKFEVCIRKTKNYQSNTDDDKLNIDIGIEDNTISNIESIIEQKYESIIDNKESINFTFDDIINFNNIQE